MSVHSAAVIRLTRPFFDESEGAAVARVLASGMLVQGATVAAFERAVGECLSRDGERHPEVIAVTNGTTALELCLATPGVGPGDEVIVPAMSWPSPGHAVLLRGATPVLVDLDPVTWNLDPRALSRALTPRTRAVIAIDQFGVPADVLRIRSFANDLDLIEDAACALGSSLGGVPCGLLGDVGTYSFHPRKVITTGEGGMVLTRDAARAAQVRALRNHGQSSPGIFPMAGPNARMSELHAAVGLAQMEKLDAILQRRKAMAEEVRAAVALAWQGAPEGAVVNHQTLGFVLPAPEEGPHANDRRGARDALIAAMRADGVEANILSYALHRLPAFASHAVNATRSFPVTDRVVDGGVAVPLHPGMSAHEVSTLIDALRRHAGWAIGRAA